MKRFIVGDIHGAYKALRDVLEKANFNEQEDTLYAVGDYVDGWPESAEVIRYLKGLPHFKGVLGNHDDWAANWLAGRRAERIWTSQGGQATINSYMSITEEEKREHSIFLSLLPTFIQEDDLFVCHGGTISLEYLRDMPSYAVDPWDLIWDRMLFMDVVRARKNSKDISISPYRNVFVGHTTTSQIQPDLTPFHYQGFWNIDQGAGWEGKLTVVDIDTDEWWQSELSSSYYPNVKGRG